MQSNTLRAEDIPPLAASNLIVVVDDDESVRDSTKTLLRSVGYRAVSYASAEEFLEADLLSETFCMLLDVRMPGMNGLELHRKLKEEGRQVPVIFITAHANASMRQEARQNGAIDLLDKPFDSNALLAAVDTAFDFANSRMEATDSRMEARDLKNSAAVATRPSIVVIGDCAEDNAELTRLLDRLPYRVVSYRSIAEAAESIANAAVVLCDSESRSGSWRDIVAQIKENSNPPLVVVMSRLPDDRLWASVLSEGGYDVLAKPYRAREVLQSVTSACRWWESYAQKAALKRL